MMKRLTLLLISLLCAVALMAQELTVKSFTLAQNDISASTNVRNDNNGDACALIKVRLAMAGAAFNGNIVGSTSYQKGEYWVYARSIGRSVRPVTE